MTDKPHQPERIGAYEVLEELSKSSRSRVYKAVLPPSQHPVVIKVLPASESEDPDHVAKFHQEVGALREINDSNVALILDSGQAEQSLVSRKDLFGDLKLPLAFTDGDRAKIEATIHNRADNKAEIRLPYDKFLVAGRLSMKPETFSRALASLREHGVRTDGNLVSIDDVAALQRFANEA